MPVKRERRITVPVKKPVKKVVTQAVEVPVQRVVHTLVERRTTRVVVCCELCGKGGGSASGAEDSEARGKERESQSLFSRIFDPKMTFAVLLIRANPVCKSPKISLFSVKSGLPGLQTFFPRPVVLSH